MSEKRPWRSPPQDLKKPLNPAGYWVVPCPISPPCPLQPGGVDRGRHVATVLRVVVSAGSVLLVGWGERAVSSVPYTGWKRIEPLPMFTGALCGRAWPFSAHHVSAWPQALPRGWDMSQLCLPSLALQGAFSRELGDQRMGKNGKILLHLSVNKILCKMNMQQQQQQPNPKPNH